MGIAESQVASGSIHTCGDLSTLLRFPEPQFYFCDIKSMLPSPQGAERGTQGALNMGRKAEQQLERRISSEGISEVMPAAGGKSLLPSTLLSGKYYKWLEVRGWKLERMGAPAPHLPLGENTITYMTCMMLWGLLSVAFRLNCTIPRRKLVASPSSLPSLWEPSLLS